MDARKLIQQLVDIDVEEGRTLVQALDVDTAQWFSVSEAELATYQDSEGESRVAVILLKATTPSRTTTPLSDRVLRTYKEDENFGVSYVVWFCRHCNTMCQHRDSHLCARGPFAGKKPAEVNP